MKSRKHTLLPLAAITGLALATTAHAATLAGQLGILDLTANGGINPANGSAWEAGDQYRFVFVVSAANALDPNDKTIADFNAHMQTVANGSSLNIGAATWKVLGSTAEVDARDNTSTNPNVDGTGHAIMLVDGATIIANDFVDLWNGTIQNAIFRTEENLEPVSSPNFARFPYTGTNTDGTAVAGQELGVPNDGNVRAASSAATNGQWINGGSNFVNNTQGSYYAMSDILTVIPEPSVALLCATGLLVLLRRRR